MALVAPRQWVRFPGNYTLIKTILLLQCNPLCLDASASCINVKCKCWMREDKGIFQLFPLKSCTYLCTHPHMHVHMKVTWSLFKYTVPTAFSFGSYCSCRLFPPTFWTDCLLCYWNNDPSFSLVWIVSSIMGAALFSVQCLRNMDQGGMSPNLEENRQPPS